MRKIRKLLSFCLAVFIIFTNISPAFADYLTQYDFVEYEDEDEDNYESGEYYILNKNSEDDRASTNDDDVIEIEYEDQEKPVGYVKLTFSGSENLKIKNNKSYYVKKDVKIKLSDPRIIKPEVEAKIGYKFKSWDKDDKTLIDSDTVVRAKDDSYPDVILVEDEKTEKPPGYVEVEFRSSKIITCNPEKTYYVNPKKKVMLDAVTASGLPGWEFAGWSTDIDKYRRYCHDMIITPIATASDFWFPGIDPDIKVVFKSSSRLHPYEIIYNTNPNFYKIFSPMDPTPDPGYEFVGWDTNIRKLRQYKNDTVINAIFRKAFPDIVPAKAPSGKNNLKPDEYVELSFKDDGKTKLEGEKLFYVNPIAGVHLKDIPLPKVTGCKYYKWKGNFNLADEITSDKTYTAVYSDQPTGDENIKTVDQIQYEHEDLCPIDYDYDGEIEHTRKVFANIKLHGLKDKDFEFSKVYPNGQELILRGQITDSRNQKKDLSKKLSFDPHNLSLYFLRRPDYFFEKSNDFTINKLADISLTKAPSDCGKILTRKAPPKYDSSSKTQSYTMDIYQTQNTYLKFNTIDKDGNEIENPIFGKFTYKIGDEIGNSGKDIPQTNEKFDAYKDNYVNFDNKEKFDGTNKPVISLDNANEGVFIYKSDEDFAYKILKTKQNSLSDPLEVTLVKKQKVIKDGERPKIKDKSGNYLPDDDYVKVDFKTGEHSRIEGENPVYWVLKDVNLGSTIKAPKAKTDYGYGFNDWEPWFEVKNQKYSQDTSYEAKIDKINYIGNLPTYAGDTTTHNITLNDDSGLGLIGLVDEYGIYKEDQLKAFIDLENIPEKVRVSLANGVMKGWGKKELKVPIKMKVDKSFGDDILRSPNKQLERETILFANDKFGNANWLGIRYTIRNQNTKGNVSPKEKETFKNVYLSKEEIYDAVRNGEFTYNNGVPRQNKSGDNALHRQVNGKNLLNPDKVKEFNISDEDYKKIDFSRIGQQIVPVTITYLDNSKSEVKVKINIKENVPTGLNEQTKHTPKILLALGTIGILVSVLNLKKKFVKI